MTLQDICKVAEYFILGEEQCWFNHFVVIQSKNRYKAKFVLAGASGMKDIIMQSVCDRYVPIVHTTDQKYNKFNDYDIVEIFHTRKSFFEYQKEQILKANKEEYGNDMNLILVETFVKSSSSNYGNHDMHIYYHDPESNLVFKELFDWYFEDRDTKGYSIVPATTTELCVDEEGEDLYKKIIGLDGLHDKYYKDFFEGPLSKMFIEKDFKIHNLGTL